MTIEELFEELREVPGSASTAHITFSIKLRDENDVVRDLPFGVTRVGYESGVVVITLALNPDARMPPGPEGNGPTALAVALRREVQHAKRQLAKKRRGPGKVIRHQKTAPDDAR